MKVLGRTYHKDGEAALNPPEMSELEDSLAEVKMLHKAKFGDDVVDEHQLKAQALEDSLAEVMRLYKVEFGQDIVEKEEGGQFGIDAPSPLDLSELEGCLAEVKMWHKEKVGHNVDDDELPQQHDEQMCSVEWWACFVRFDIAGCVGFWSTTWMRGLRTCV